MFLREIKIIKIIKSPVILGPEIISANSPILLSSFLIHVYSYLILFYIFIFTYYDFTFTYIKHFFYSINFVAMYNPVL